ncbi:STAS-like domain-containing protein [Tenacibaculum ovolyticum]|uniref:STAS-like domain-containing protein n=1 Tax=Tenacibaculum ovolyticum TaxID=104270 RepID=UPI0022F3E1D8|nr:STAS-like domain-containing protein [Tenacibaculum ovolyticum]WBX78304.1 STAS-like domain-containing protein [Tenacibaculum ovolyticum]
MKNINLDDFGPIISTKESGDKILKLVTENLKNNNKVSVDLKKIRSMATFCAKQIFGKLYVTLGAEKFFEDIEIINASDDLKSIIKIGIQSAIQETVSG